MIFQRACCFCGEAVTRADPDAVEVALRNLWGGQSVQGLQAHSACIVRVFPDFAMVDPPCLRD
ncbi:MAG: hypothetical protein A2623_08995 [Caulobacterales bacterium RIFCSPHIGHO2_01_FULL_70_19]|nr:MAG: hypothetical protein A2623_08995 [Caulobacterales bacterium RIFCSPHIGHO2_01_FULL_70_19]